MGFLPKINTLRRKVSEMELTHCTVVERNKSLISVNQIKLYEFFIQNT